jgi:putative transcriptional regulator
MLQKTAELRRRAIVIQCRLRELMAFKSRISGQKVTYDSITAKTGLFSSTLTKLANNKADLIGIRTMDRLCVFFDCQPGDLFVYLPSPNLSDVSSGV